MFLSICLGLNQRNRSSIYCSFFYQWLDLLPFCMLCVHNHSPIAERRQYKQRSPPCQSSPVLHLNNNTLSIINITWPLPIDPLGNQPTDSVTTSTKATFQLVPTPHVYPLPHSGSPQLPQTQRKENRTRRLRLTQRHGLQNRTPKTRSSRPQEEKWINRRHRRQTNHLWSRHFSLRLRRRLHRQLRTWLAKKNKATWWGARRSDRLGRQPLSWRRRWRIVRSR